MALLSSSLRRAGGNACRLAADWAECALNLAFPWPHSAEAEPVRIGRPFCQQCGYPYPALDTHDADFVCSSCATRKWHFQWARSGYRTGGQVLEAIIGFKYGDQYYRQQQLVGWLTETFDQHANVGKWDALVPVPLYHPAASGAGIQPSAGNCGRAGVEA
jgi:predicted amidophosphoribosyltransferase